MKVHYSNRPIVKQLDARMICINCGKIANDEDVRLGCLRCEGSGISRDNEGWYQYDSKEVEN